MDKKAQSASSAAAFIAVMTIAIILYVLFLPPDVRNDLLGPGTATGTNSTGGTSSSSQLLEQKIGRVTFVNTKEKSYDIPTVRIYTPTSGQVIQALPSMSIRNALFDTEKSTYSMDFNIDKTATKNVMLSFTVKEYSGPLSITLNGREIFSSEISLTNPQPIQLDSGLLTDKNTLAFSVPSPGWAFWNANKYTLQNVQITGDVTETKNSAAIQYFTITESEKTNLDTIRLFFNPVCTVSNVGPLQIELNRKIVFDSIADCGTKSFAALDNNYVLQGSNELRFSTTSGQYLLDNLKVDLTLKKPALNTYFFDMTDTYFKTKEERAVCGTYDGICPPGCSDVEDSDCCFRHNGFWCALPTSNSNDRCVFYVDGSDCDLCRTGYYDSSGDVPNNCENKCGDNNDDRCLSSCQSPSRNYDKDCCYAANKDNFWCKEVPITGIADKCRASISSTQCDLCPSGYINTDGSSPDACTGDNFKYTDTTTELLSNYQVKFTVRFIDDTTRHRVDFNINGHRVSVDTYNIEYTKIIDAYVEQGTNTIEISPIEDIDIAEIKVEIQQVS